MSLSIIICIKSIITHSNNGKFIRSTDNCRLNPFDRPVISMGKSLIDQYGGTLTIITMGPESAKYALHEAMSMGADRGILICDRFLKGSDTYVTSKVLGSAIQKIKYDLVLFGTRSSDSDTGQVGPQTAEMLGIPFLINIHSLGHIDNSFVINRNADGYSETFKTMIPAAFTVDLTSSETNHTTLYEIENTFENKEIETWRCKDIGLLESDTGLLASPTKIISLNKRKSDKSCEFLDGSLDKQAEALAERLSQAGLVG